MMRMNGEVVATSLRQSIAPDEIAKMPTAAERLDRLYLRVLGPSNAGKYYTAIVVIGFADVFTNFGLNLCVERLADSRQLPSALRPHL